MVVGRRCCASVNARSFRTKAAIFQPQFEKIDVVTGRFALAKGEDIKRRDSRRHERRDERAEQRPMRNAEKQQEQDHGRERSAGDEPEEIAFQSPRLAGGVVRAVRFREAQFGGGAVAHWNEPTSTVELSRPKAVKSAFTM